MGWDPSWGGEEQKGPSAVQELWGLGAAWCFLHLEMLSPLHNGGTGTLTKRAPSVARQAAKRWSRKEPGMRLIRL